jgi:Lectin C-type domain
VYLKPGNASSWDDASAECAALGEGARLAKVNTPRLNEFLAGIFDADGDWIGLRSNKGEDWVWADGAALADGEEQWAGFDGKAEAAQVQQDMNGAACAVADRRGSGQNWDVLSCSAERTYVCEVLTGSAAAKAACGGDLFDGQSSANGHTPVNAADCPTVAGMSCSTEENKKLDGLEPFCASSGDVRSNKEAICCDGGGVSKGLIAGTALGVILVLMVIVIVIVVYCCVRRKPSSSSAATSTPNSDVPSDRRCFPRRQRKKPSESLPTDPTEAPTYPAFPEGFPGATSASASPRPWQMWR